MYRSVPTAGPGDEMLPASVVASTPRLTRALKNHILDQLPAPERAALLAEAEYVEFAAGETFAAAGAPIASVFFPETGVISSIGEMATGHHVAVLLVGAEGLIGVGRLFGVPHYPHRLAVLLRCAGNRIDAARFDQAFAESPTLRALTLHHAGRVVNEIATLAACGRVHSHRQRLARWLLVATDKAGQQSLPITHDVLAQMVGGPRHAATVAVNELREKGAITHLRGRIDVIDRSLLIAEACECYAAR